MPRFMQLFTYSENERKKERDELQAVNSRVARDSYYD